MNAPDIEGFWSSAEEMAEFLLDANDVTVVAHIDADGVSSASIASSSLERAGVPHRVRFIKKLDPPEMESVNMEGTEAVWLVDLGSGSYSQLRHPGACVSDHHVPDMRARGLQRSGQNTLFSFFSRHLNPHLFGIDGSTELSGSGTTYCVAKKMDARNRDLSAIALVGAVGDFQDSAECRLNGFNRTILAEAENEGVIRAEVDIRLFGRETRPVDRLLQYSADPYLPGLTNNRDGCRLFILEQGVDLKEGERWRRWVDLTREEKVRMTSALCHLLLDSGRGAAAVRRMIGEVYILPKEKEGTELHDAKEFSTLLNACGRYGFAEVGLQVCKGDRGQSLETAVKLQRNHRSNLAGAIEQVKEMGLRRREWIQYFHGQDEIIDSIVGIVAGMVLASGDIPSDLPVIAFALSEGDKVKVSARGTRDMVRKGLDLASAIRLAAESVGGTGGGHNIAAGATIGTGMEEDFLDEIERIIARQMGAGREA